MKFLRKLTNRKRSVDDIIFDSTNTVFLILLCIVMLYPMLNTLAVSFNEATDSVRGGIYLWPREFTLYNYQHVFGEAQLLQAGVISVLRTVVGTAISVICTAMVAYTISRQYFVLRKFVTIAFVLTMYFNGGLIPTYLLMRELSLIGSFWIYIVPGIIGVFNLIVVRSFIEGLPETIFESAKIDGAGEFTMFFKIALPLCIPVIATISLFVAVGQWNSWFDVFLYNSSKPELSTLQYELMKILQSSSANTASRTTADAFANAQNVSANTVTPTSIRAAMTMIVSIPIICVYPFLQKYFVKGLTLGGVKG
ncbi:carbohydrate ABC transporter permease [Anaerobacillus sp. CMMVII]|uniref:carbohydrate ABC transporter permease n=1 Tax=Anaerobacillus sp. CMMVII TaxID=2755588 RepID=UPI0021B71393|nr:carbohydrate ABC transporter permease [Anaerobacillus sp. CMMVII]MCT8137110.1 carbohydrate ABC transporter permease [Anaerobacillus sp. CMMVII]